MNIFLISMGCAKNSVDSEVLSGYLQASGHKIKSSAKNSDVAIVNTCGFIQDAVKENIDVILDLEDLKKRGAIKKIIVAGCLVNRYEKELAQEFPTVDLFAHSEDWQSIIKFLGGDIKKSCERSFKALNKNFWTRFLKISEGCDTLCSYCAIPIIRGRLRSIPIKNLVDEALMLCSAGAKEICLVGQDLTVYGKDFQNNTSLENLLSALNNELPSGTWLRLLYLHPNRINERMIDFLFEHEKILHYLDIPIQHADSKILSLMNRPAPAGHFERIFKYIRSLDNLFTLRTTIMTGFPGETDENFERVIDFIREIEFDRLGVFTYSPEEGTRAANFPDQVPHEISEQRCNLLSDIQAGISQERSELFLGRELDVLIEDIDPAAEQLWGRSPRDAPEIDGMTCVSKLGGKKFKRGDLVHVKINDCAGNDLFGELI